MLWKARYQLFSCHTATEYSRETTTLCRLQPQKAKQHSVEGTDWILQEALLYWHRSLDQEEREEGQLACCAKSAVFHIKGERALRSQTHPRGLCDVNMKRPHTPSSRG